MSLNKYYNNLKINKNNLFTKTFRISKIYKAYYDLYKGNRILSSNAKNFSLYKEENIFNLYEELHNGSYVMDKYFSFYSTIKKDRIIYTPTFRDKIVQRCIYNKIKNELDIFYSSNSYACIKGRGNTNAVLKIQEYINEYKDFTFIKLDISKYFNNINKNILNNIIDIIFPNDYVFKSLLCNILWSKYSKYITNKGLPLGNHLSQIFGNIYLHCLDMYIEEKYNCNYIRYMDDIILIFKDKIEYKDIILDIKIFLKNTLDLTLADNKTEVYYNPNFVSCLGFKIYKDKIHLQKFMCKKIKNAIFKNNITLLNTYIGLYSNFTDVSYYIESLIKIYNKKNLKVIESYTLNKGKIKYSKNRKKQVIDLNNTL